MTMAFAYVMRALQKPYLDVAVNLQVKTEYVQINHYTFVFRTNSVEELMEYLMLKRDTETYDFVMREYL